jgi:UDP-2,3-diacylglucosamine pyrophosphatase LpxH
MNGSVRRYRAVFISDLHLGSAGCQVEAITQFLQSFECDQLYLVGDIIDGWVGRDDGRWGQGTTELVRLLLGKTNRENCRVYYTPGNHDAFMRRLLGSEMGSILIDHSFVHTTVTGRDLLVVHGDLFDRSCTKFLPVAWVGAWLYEAITILNAHVNRTRARRERRPIHFASMVKLATKRIVKRGSSFENQLVEHAVENGCDGVICGHVHRPAIREREDGKLYINTGDWVEHCTAIAETLDGRIEMIEWKPEVSDIVTPAPSEGLRRVPALLRR